MHHKTKESAVAKYGAMLQAGSSRDEVLKAMSLDDKGFTQEDIDEIEKAITEAPPPTAKKKAPIFNYRDLKDAEFDGYLEHFNKLTWTEKHDFELYSAAGIFKKAQDENFNVINKLSGIRIKDIIPKHTTRITVSQARDLNAQIEQNSATNTGFYYLLKQPA